MERIYLDNAATTPTDPAVVKEMLPCFGECFGNASSLHKSGRAAVALVDKARERVARAIGASPNEIYFTSGGTEADNFAMIGLAKAYKDKGKHIVASCVEHPAVLSALKRLEEEGFDVTYLPVDEGGVVNVNDAVSAIKDDTILLSVMYVNNEVGSVQPIRELAAVAKERGVKMHTDAVQAVGTFPIDVKTLGVDALSLSAHKFYGPKGVGALYVKSGTKIKGILVGGEQERALRGGTYNTPAIVGLGKAIEIATTELKENASHLSDLKTRFASALLCDLVTLNGSLSAHPGILNLRFSGIKNSELLSALDQSGVEASAGSACSAGSALPSHVLKAMGLSDQEVSSSVRFSFGKENTFDQINRAVKIIKELLPRLREEVDLFRRGASDKKDV